MTSWPNMTLLESPSLSSINSDVHNSDAVQCVTVSESSAVLLKILGKKFVTILSISGFLELDYE